MSHTTQTATKQDPPNPQPTQNPKNNSDSKTKVYLRLHGQRDVVSIRVKPELKQALSKFCRANGLSFCHVFEMLVSGYLTGMKHKMSWVNQSPTIELTVVREVKRVRRYAREGGGGRDVFVEDQGSVERCWFCEEKSVAVHFVQVDRYRCIRQFACFRHHEELKHRGIAWNQA